MSQNLQQEWKSVIEKLKKDKSQLYEFLKDSNIELDGDSFKLYIPNEDDKNKAQKSLPKILAKLPAHLKIKKLLIVVGNLVLSEQSTNTSPSKNIAPLRRNSILSPALIQMKKIESPLQKLNQFVELKNIRNAEQVQIQDTLNNAVEADKTCSDLYEKLKAKTERLAEETIEVNFSWLLRVGGTRGFRELLLPVFHPVYGIPYIPASSLKGAIRAIAQQNNEPELYRLLGNLEDGIGCIQILDAFPTKPCLSVDIVNPQWHWTQSNQVEYKSEPHCLLSLKQPKFVIGFSRTNRGKNVSNPEDLSTIKTWLEKALTAGIGSRVSAGYGRTYVKASLEHSSTHDFKIWTQGMYGVDTQKPEFRPVALRGMLRYWFRAIALGIYPPDTAKKLEAILFGTIEPKSKLGTIRIGVEWKEEGSGGRQYPYFYNGKILLESSNERHLDLIKNLLYLSSHLAGFGRGSRRPLHLNNGRMRGCYWEITSHQLLCDHKIWQELIQQIKVNLQELGNQENFSSASNLSIPRPVINHHNRNRPVRVNNISSGRYQDILDSNAAIFLVPSPGMKHPNSVEKWSENGSKKFVLGEALNLLYSNDKYKGYNKDTYVGNAEVGGKLGIPSYVIIQSNFPGSNQQYQAVTIFGKNHLDRTDFIEHLPKNCIQVW